MTNHESQFEMPPKPPLEVPPDADADQLRDLLGSHGVRYLRLVFTDSLGAMRQLEVTERQFARALDGRCMFDGNAVPGFARLEESDMMLQPDPRTLRLLPELAWGARTALVVCDVYRSDGEPAEGDPRGALKRILAQLSAEGYTAQIGAEVKFFLFGRSPDGAPRLQPHDQAGYLDPGPTDGGLAVRRDIAGVLDALGFAVEATHHEIAPAQHEVNFRYDDALATADKLTLLRTVVRQVADRHGLHASFMPKPLPGISGSGLHVHQSLNVEGTNAFFDPEAPDGLSNTLRFYVGGLLRHARGFCAITNPLVNSYKRLVPGSEAPVFVTWALQNRSALIRVPAQRGDATRVELRMPDPAANPYLSLAVQLAAGLEGIRDEIDPGEPVHGNVAALTTRELQRLRIRRLPRSLVEALEVFEQDRLVRTTLGEHIYGFLLQARRREWREYTNHVHPWEVERYL
jgi:glutamine synthetase